MKRILTNTFYQLLVIYTLLILAISLGFLWKYTLHFEIFAIIIAVLGIFAITNFKKENIVNNTKPSQFEKLINNSYLHYILFALAIIFILSVRILPYIQNSIPLGYDAGIYRYGIEHGLQNKDMWILGGGMEPGFLYLMKPLTLIFSPDFMLIWGFIFFNLVLGIAIYFFTKEYFNKTTALIALLLFAVSVIQFKVFEFMYYKNIIALSLMLFSLYFMNKKNNKSRIFFIALAGLTGAIHRPTFYILMLSLFAYYVYTYKSWKKNLINFIIILAIAGIFYLGDFSIAITNMISPVLTSFVNPGEAAGTFVSFFSYQFLTLAYLPLAILGAFILIKRKQFNILFFWTLINASIVYFQLFFFNRFIIHLDIALIILAAFAFSELIKEKKKLGTIILIVLLFSSGLMLIKEASTIKPLITQSALDLIINSNTEPNAQIMSISSQYSPWVKGYSQRTTIAPGLFDENKWNQAQWNIFWENNDTEQIKQLMSAYLGPNQGPIYLFAGSKEFNNSCFELFKENNGNKLYKYVC